MKTVIRYSRKVLTTLRNVHSHYHLPDCAKREERRDKAGLSNEDPGIDNAVTKAIGWLARAQDNSLSKDGGVARDFSLITGWSTSYPETTGYIVPTMLAYADRKKDQAIRDRAKRMLDWLVAIQFSEGGFQGSVIGASPVVPVTFNTGQILLGLASGAKELGEKYFEPMCRAADWLVMTQDKDGCWRRHSSPFAEPGEKAYETHVAWGLLEAAKLKPNSDYAQAALANIRWALTLQQPNGWFQSCCLSDPVQPLTHTLGYALRGVVEAQLFTSDKALLEACRRTADGLITAISSDGFLPGRLDANWRGTVRWACLTGSVQVAYCLLILFRQTREPKYRDAAYALNSYVRRTVRLDGPAETLGAVKGAFPTWGDYCPYAFPNWASKFFVDSNLLELDARQE